MEECGLCGAPFDDERPVAYNIIRNGKRVRACAQCGQIVRTALLELVIPHVHAGPIVTDTGREPGAISIIVKG